MRSICRRLAFSAWLTVAVGLAGCASSVSVRPLAGTDLDKVKGRQLAIVLFQIRATIDGKPVSPLEPGDSNNSFRIYRRAGCTGLGLIATGISQGAYENISDLIPLATLLFGAGVTAHAPCG
jgi:hypothetical protein